MGITTLPAKRLTDYSLMQTPPQWLLPQQHLLLPPLVPSLQVLITSAVPYKTVFGILQSFLPCPWVRTLHAVMFSLSGRHHLVLRIW